MAHILIVDDSLPEVQALQEILINYGHQISTANSGEQALAQIQQHRPDLVLMDIVMPGMNGFQATRRINRDPATSAIPVIMVTTKDQETDRIWGLRQGARDFITKPVDEQELLTKITFLLKG